MVTLSRLGRKPGAVNSFEPLIILQWEYHWIDEVDNVHVGMGVGIA